MLRQLALVLSIGVLSLSAACTGRRAGGGSGCVPGMSVACACPGGVTGAQVCRDDRSYGPCSCSGDGDAGSSGVDGSSGRDGSSGADGSSGRDGGSSGHDGGTSTDAGRDAGSGGTNLCTSSADRAATSTTYAGRTVEQIVYDCAFECFGGGDIRTCVDACMNDATGGTITAPCRGCYVDTAQCAADNLPQRVHLRLELCDLHVVPLR